MVAVSVDRGSASEENRLEVAEMQFSRVFASHEGNVRLDDINILMQTRRTFTNIENLANDIARKGLMHKQAVTRLTRAECIEYLWELNQVMPGAAHHIRQLHRAKDGYYYVLIAGERRTRALWHLHECGCRAHIDIAKPRKLKKGACLGEHFPDRLISVTIYTDLSADEALEIQLSENTHEQVPEHEEASVYSALFRARRMRNKRYSLRQFAHEVGRPERWVRRALRFCDLPDAVKGQVEQNELRYTVAAELSRLLEIDISDEDFAKKWIGPAILEGWNSRYAARRVTAAINDHDMLQTSMVDMFGKAQEDRFRNSQRKKVVERKHLREVRFTTAHWRTLVRLFANETLGREDAPYVLGENPAAYMDLIDTLADLLPYLNDWLTELQEAKAAGTLEFGREVFTGFTELFDLDLTLPGAPAGEPSLFAEVPAELVLAAGD